LNSDRFVAAHESGCDAVDGSSTGSTPILTDDVERVLADIDTDHVDLAVEYLGHGMLLCLRCPCQSGSLAGLEHGRTIPFSVIERAILL
jgi:hypothetical protein